MSAPDRRDNRVSFSALSSVARYAADEAEESTFTPWYTPEETRDFKQRMLSDAVRLRDLLRASASNGGAAPLSEEDLHETVGLEKFLSPSRVRRDRARIRSHLEAVVAEQESQARSGVRSSKRLSMVAQNSSQLSRERAHALALAR